MITSYITTKILVFALIFAILFSIREIYAIIFALTKGKEIDMSTKRQILLATAISYIFTIIFTGFKLF